FGRRIPATLRYPPGREGLAMNRNPAPRMKSIAALQRSGMFRKDKHPRQRSPSATPGRPSTPLGLDALALEAWDAVVLALEDMGVIHLVDSHAITQYARLYSETETITVQRVTTRAAIEAINPTIASLKGAELSQAIAGLVDLAKLDAKYTDQLRNGRNAIRLYLGEFGLTPASRNRIRIPEAAPDTADPFAVLANGRPAGVSPFPTDRASAITRY